MNNYQTKTNEMSQNFKSPGCKTYAQMVEGVPKNAIDRSREAKDCLRCGWLPNQKGAHRMMKCFQNVNVTSGTSDFKNQKHSRG
jgi:hypothetical protein